MAGPPTASEQAAFKAAEDAQNQRVFEENKANIARAQRVKDENYDHWLKNDSPQALAQQKKAMEESDAALNGTLTTVGALITGSYLMSRGGLSSEGSMMGEPGGFMAGIMSFLGVGPAKPAQQAGATNTNTTTNKNDNIFSMSV